MFTARRLGPGLGAHWRGQTQRGLLTRARGHVERSVGGTVAPAPAAGHLGVLGLTVAVLHTDLVLELLEAEAGGLLPDAVEAVTLEADAQLGEVYTLAEEGGGPGHSQSEDIINSIDQSEDSITWSQPGPGDWAGPGPGRRSRSR